MSCFTEMWSLSQERWGLQEDRHWRYALLLLVQYVLICWQVGRMLCVRYTSLRHPLATIAPWNPSLSLRSQRIDFLRYTDCGNKSLGLVGLPVFMIVIMTSAETNSIFYFSISWKENDRIFNYSINLYFYWISAEICH